MSLEPIVIAKSSVRQPITPVLPAPRVPQPATQVIPDPRVPVSAGQPTIAPAPRVPIVGSPVRGIPLPRVLAPRPVSPPPSPRVRVDTTVTGTAPSNPPQSPVPVNPRTSQSAMPVGRHTGQTFSQCPAMNTRGRAPRPPASNTRSRVNRNLQQALAASCDLNGVTVSASNLSRRHFPKDFFSVANAVLDAEKC